MKDRQRRDGALFPVRLDQQAQVEIGEVVGVADQEHLLTIYPGPVGGERARAAEQFRFVGGAHGRRPGSRFEVVTHHIRKVVQVDEYFVHARPVERVEPDVEHRLAADGNHALGDGVRDRPQPAADAGGEQEGLHVPAFRTTPRARIRASASASTPSRPSMPLSHSAYAATESAGVRWGSQPSARRALISDRMCRVSPKRYSPVTIPGTSDPYWRMTMPANSRVVTALPPPTLKTRPAARSSESTSTLASTTSSMLT